MAKVSAKDRIDWTSPHFRDSGCEGGCDRSLECPLAVCVEDDHQARRQRTIRAKYVEIRELRDGGASLEEIGAKMSLKRRQVERYLKGGTGNDVRKA